MPGKLRADAPARLLEAVAALGGSRERILAAAGLTAADLADTDRPIEIATCLQLINAAARGLVRDCFGLHAGSLIDLGMFGPLTYAVYNAPTVGIALGNFERYARSHFQGPRIASEVDGREAQLALLMDVQEGISSRHHD